MRAKLGRFLSPWLRSQPAVRKAAKSLDVYVNIARHSAAAVLPQIIQPDPRDIYVTLTANCNLRYKAVATAVISRRARSCPCRLSEIFWMIAKQQGFVISAYMVVSRCFTKILCVSSSIRSAWA